MASNVGFNVGHTGVGFRVVALDGEAVARERDGDNERGALGVTGIFAGDLVGEKEGTWMESKLGVTWAAK